MIGLRLGGYQVTGALGRGGMGEVWRAEDTRLGREVALKVLPAGFTDDPERIARFEREARVLASLNHPNIATLYGLETAASAPASSTAASGATSSSSSSSSSQARADAGAAQYTFLVMELVEGEGLDDLIARGAIPVAEALPLARQIAEALEAAHEASIVHRDLKPANVRIRPDGTVKVLDFGLAKAWQSESGSGSDLSLSPTMTRHGTAAGVILGTASYMSPEQARGKPVDRRADIWAFGVVLWEMLTGRQLFEGDTLSDVVADVLRAEIDLAALPQETPPAVRRLLRRCLERQPHNRLRDIGDARLVLQEVIAGDDDGSAPAEGSRSAATVGARSRWTWAFAALAVVATAVAIAALAGRHRAPAAEPRRLAIIVPAEQHLITDGNTLITFDNEGRSMVVTGDLGGRQVLLRRQLGDSGFEAIAGTDDGQAAFFSPDGQWLGFIAAGRLFKLPVAGGTPFTIGECQGSGGAAWLPDNTIVFNPTYSDGLYRVTAEGGEPSEVTTPDRAAGELGHWWPQSLPDHRHVLFTAFRTPVDHSRIGVVDLADASLRWVVDGGFFGRYVATGHLLYAKGNRLYAVPFDAASASVTGPAVALVDDLRVSQTGGFAMFAVSARGDLAYVMGSSGDPDRQLVWLDRSGHAQPATEQRARYLSVSLAPDGRRAAVTIQGDSRDLWIYTFERGTLSRLTSSADTEFDPTWSADARELFYVVDRPPFDLYRIAASAPDSGHPVFEQRAELDTLAPTVSPDGRWLAFVLSSPGTRNDIFSRRLDGSEPARPFRASRAMERSPSFSPDGRWLAYQSDETGRAEIYVEAFPGPGERFQVTADGGTQPHWSSGSGEIFFRHDNQVRVVSTTADGDRIDFGPLEQVVEYPIARAEAVEARTYDVAADGQRILVVSTPDADLPRRIELVTDWTGELRRRVPSRGR